MPTTPHSSTSKAADDSIVWEQRVGRFEVTGELGTGGMGVVLSAFDPQLERRVAIKLIRDQSGPDQRERMLTEARAMAQLNHPNVVKVFEAGVDDGQVYLAMEEIDGGTLRDYLKGNELNWREIIALFVEAGQGLGAAHAIGLVHRDFKSENVLIGRDGRVCVIDFGLVGAPIAGRVTSAALGGPETQVDQAIGTPSYMAPEQQDGSAIDARVDQFAFCVSLWEALFGQLPFAGEDNKSYYMSIKSGAIVEPARSEVPQWVRDILHRGLSADPEERFASMSALLAEFADDRFRPVGRSRSLFVVLTTAFVAAPLVGMFVKPSFTRMAVVIGGASIVCLLLLWRVREMVWRNAFNRRMTRALVLVVGCIVIAAAGLRLLEADQAISRLINPLIMGAVGAIFAVAVERRLISPIALFVVAFFVGVSWPTIAPVAFSVANFLAFIVLVMTWRQGDRIAIRQAAAIARIRAARSRPAFRTLDRDMRQIGRFPIVRRIESAASADLFEAYDPELQRVVTLWYGDSAQSSSIRHANIVTVFESGEHSTFPYSVMEPLSGRTLATVLRSDSDWREVVDQYVNAGRGLAAAHKRGILHRGFSAAYAFVDAGEVRIGGFRSRTSKFENTRAMLAPEVIDGQPATAASDQFSFCAALYASLFGEPFDSSSEEAYRKSVAAGPRDPVNAAPSWLRRILERGLRERPDERFADMDALLELLKPEPRDFGPGRRLWTYLIFVLPFASAMPLYLKGLPVDPADALSYFEMAAINLVALIPLLVVGLMMRSHLAGTMMSRTLFGAFGVGLGSTLILIAGSSIADIPPRVVECLHLLLFGTVVAALSALHDKRLWPAAAALVAAFLIAATAPHLIYVCIFIGVAALTINLAVTLRD